MRIVMQYIKLTANNFPTDEIARAGLMTIGWCGDEG
jgi:hypothetical protein